MTGQDRQTGKDKDPFAMASRIKTRGPAPVHLWDPPFCGDIDMLIKRDGSWLHEGRPIRRAAMVRLFTSILKREGDDYFLVTPVEKVGIRVEDSPFVITGMEVEGSGSGQRIVFTTNTGESVPLDQAHPLWVATDADSGEPRPRVTVRNNLPGLINRSVFYRLVELAVEKPVDGEATLGVWSEAHFFPLGRA